MRKYVIGILSFCILSLTACTTKKQSQSQVAEKQTDSVAVTSDRPVYDQLLAELDSAEVYDDSILYGYWFKPHEASSVNIFFHKDNTYEFKYYQVDKDDNIIDKFKKGKYTINGEIITLTSDEGWDDYFNGVMNHKHNSTNHYLTDKTDDLYLVKGSD